MKIDRMTGLPSAHNSSTNHYTSARRRPRPAVCYSAPPTMRAATRSVLFLALAFPLAVPAAPLPVGGGRDEAPLVQIWAAIDAIYNFGDSISDTGNFLLESGGGVIGSLPYGETIGKATGRFSDGLLMIDYLGCAKILERALFLIGEIGGNDYNYALLDNKSIEEVKTYVPHVVNAIVHAIKEVINLGATQLIVPGNFPIGCFPIYLTVFGKEDSVFDRRNCSRDWNEFAEFHNKYLQSSLNNLRRDYPNVLILYGDYYNAFLQLMDEANSYGFDQSSLLQACCRLDFNHTLSLNSGTPNGLICSDPAKFINWDGVHLTQKAYKNMAKQLFQRWAYTHASL